HRWHLPTREEAWHLISGGWSPPASRLTWTLDSRRLVVSAGPGPQKLLEATTGREIYTGTSDMAFCPDGKRLALRSARPFSPEDKAPGLRVFDPDSGQEIQRVERADSGTGTWSPDGKTLVVTSPKGTIQVWELESAAPGPNRLLLLGAFSFAWNPD